MNQLGSNEISFLLNAISGAVLFETPDHTILFVNQSFCDFFHIPVEPETMIGMNCSNAAIEASTMFRNPAFFLSRIENIYTNNEPVTNEELQLKDGTSVLRDYKPMFEQGEIKGHLWKYKTLIGPEKIMSQEEAQIFFYEDLFNHMPVDIAIFDLSHRYIYVNRSDFHNQEKNNWLIGKDDFDYFRQIHKDPSYAVKRREKFQEAIQLGKTVEFEEVNIDEQNNKNHYLRRYTPIKGSRGNLEYVIGYGMDITLVKESEEKLLENYKFLKELLNSIGQMVVTVNSTGNIIYVNPQWTHLTGLTIQQVKGKSIYSYIQHGFSGFYKNLNISAQEQLVNFTQENRVIVSDQQHQPHTLSYYITPFNQFVSAENEFAVFFTDITDQLKAERELLNAADKERNLSELKSNFMKMVSHELRTPLSVILSSTEILEMKYDRIDDADLSFERNYLNRIVSQVDKMTHLMNEFLFVSKIESGKIMANFMLLDLEELVAELLKEMFSPWKDGRFVNLQYKGRKKKVQFDPSMLRHILMNLLTNAFKYSPTTPLPPRIRISFSKYYWYISVQDCGIGISKEDLKAIAQPFVRGSNVGDIEGTGLGLMTIRYFTDQHQGIKMIKSTLGKGTVVTLKFPYQIENSAP